MAENSQRSGVPLTTVILLMVITALSVAVVMLWLDKKKAPSAAEELSGGVIASADRVSEAEEGTAGETAVIEEILEISSAAEIEKEAAPAAEEKTEDISVAESDAKAAPVVSSESETSEETKTSPAAGSGYVDPAQACCTVKTLSSSGTGFAVQRDGKTYVMTCRHLIERSPVLIITDSDGKELKIKKTFVAKDRDLAVFETDLPEGVRAGLPLRASLSIFANGRKVACYADTLGKGFVDKCEGKVKTTEPGYMVIDVPFPASCSGGPVVLAGTNLVIGATSLLKRFSETDMRLMEVSRFEAEPKRYCVRADDLDWNELVETDFGKVGKGDLETIRKLADSAIGSGELYQAADLLLHCAKSGDKDALSLFCDVMFKILQDRKNQPALEDFPRDRFNYLKEAADEGSAGALLDLGICYLYGIGADKDPALGFSKIEKAAKTGYAKALYMEGFCRYCGLGAARNLKAAFKSFKAGADTGDAFCMKALGSYYLNDNLPAEAFPWYEKAAKQNDPEAIFALGVLFDNGYGVARDGAAAFEYYKKSAQMGHAAAQTKLGKTYEKSEDYLSAAYWFDLAAQKYDAEAVEKLGSYYLRGIGGKPEDDDTAFMYLSFAAQQGRTAAMTFMGNFYYDQQKYGQAFEWYRKAAAKEDPEAIYKLGLMYENGRGVSQDQNMSFKCFKVAAVKGYEDAWVNLGIDYLMGRGTVKDNSQAHLWLSKAAEAGNPAAQSILGDIYCNAWGVPADRAAARIWYEKAIAGGAADAKEKLARLDVLEREDREKNLKNQLAKEAEAAESLAKQTETFAAQKQDQTPPPFTETPPAEKRLVPQNPVSQSGENQPLSQVGETKAPERKGRVLYRVKETFEKPAQSQYKSPYSKDASRAMLEVDVNGPTRIRVAERFKYSIRVKNSGSGTARNVVVKNTRPIGMSLISDPGTKSFTMSGGEMGPGCVKTFTFEAAADYAGIFIDNVSVSGENFRIKHSSLCTKVINRR